MEHCCELMKYYVEEMTESTDDVDCIMMYSENVNEYKIPIHDNEKGTAISGIVINYCPWCGKKLSESRREELFKELSKRGLDFYDMGIQKEFKSGLWWRLKDKYGCATVKELKVMVKR